MLKPGGYAIWTGETTIEKDTFTCCHCNRVVFVEPKSSPSDMGGWCMMCSKPVCPGCAGKSCTPFEKKLEAAERRDSLLRTVGEW